MWSPTQSARYDCVLPWLGDELRKGCSQGITAARAGHLCADDAGLAFCTADFNFYCLAVTNRAPHHCSLVRLASNLNYGRGSAGQLG